MTRSKGRSAVAAAAYQSGEKLYSEYDGEWKSGDHAERVVFKNILLPPNAPKAYANVTVKATAAITSLTVKIGSSSIALSGISIAAGKTVVFSYDENKILSIMTGTTSLLSKRTAKSSDDLVASCGKSNKISVVASANVTATFSVKGAFI